MAPQSQQLSRKKEEEAKNGRGSRVLSIVLLALAVILLMVCAYEIPLKDSLLDASVTNPKQDVVEDTSSLSAKTVSQPVVDKWGNRVDNLAQSLSTKPGANPLPLVKNTFVFFHTRKGGGTTLRSIISDSAKRHNLMSWIPCLTTGCVPFSLPTPGKTGYVVYAGHLNYAYMSQVIWEQQPHPSSLPNWLTKQTIQDHNVTYLSVAEDYNF